MAAGCNACIRLVCNAAHGARLRHVETVIWLLDAMRASGLCAMGARLRPGSSYSMRLVVHRALWAAAVAGPWRKYCMLSLARDAAHGAKLNFVTSAARGHGVHRASGAPAAAGPREVHLSVDRVGGWTQKSEG